MRIILLGLIALIFISCAEKSGVYPSGENTYTISNQAATGFSGLQDIKTETYKEDDTSVTKHFYDSKDSQVKEAIYLKDGIKKVKHMTAKGVVSKLEHFVDDIREGKEIRYFIEKADGSIKSIKNYVAGKLHGEKLTYNISGEVIKTEMFEEGKPVK